MLSPKKMILLFIISFGIQTPVYTETAEQRFQDSINLYDQGHYKEASEQLNSLLKEGLINGHILYNLGNSLYRDSRRGAAISAWLAARQLLPRDPNIQANLVYASQENKDQLSWERQDGLLQTFAFWMPWLSERELFLIASVVLIISLLLFIGSLLKPDIVTLRNISRAWAVCSVFLFIALAITIQNRRSPAAITSGQAQVHSAPGERNTVIFELHEGAPVNIDHEESDWYRISLSDGKTGWIHSRHLSYFKLHS